MILVAYVSYMKAYSCTKVRKLRKEKYKKITKKKIKKIDGPRCWSRENG